MHTDAPKAFATYSLKPSEIRTTNQLQPNVSTTGNTTTSHVSTFSNNTLHSRPPMTSMSSTKTNTSFLPTQSQSIPFGSITSKQTTLTTASPTSLYSTPNNSRATTSISPTKLYPPNSTSFNLTTPTTPLHLNATHYQTTYAYPITSGTQSKSLNTTFFSRNTNTSAQITHLPSLTSDENNPSSLNTSSPSFTLFYTNRNSMNNTTSLLTKTLLSSTSINTATTKSTFSNTIIPTTTPVHIVSGNKTITTNTIQSGTGPVYIIYCDKDNKTSIISSSMHLPASSTTLSLTKATPSPNLVTTDTTSLALKRATTSIKPLSAFMTGKSSPKTTILFRLSRTDRNIE